ncbi:MAG: HepT-like ribonuclease domain-containing protein [Patescibacteria group bacterium]
MQRLHDIGAHPLEEFSHNEDLFDLAQHHLRLALEGVFHIGSHLLSRLPGARITSYKEIALALGAYGIVDRSFAETALVKMAGFRTRLTHFYHEIKPAELYEIIRQDLGDIEQFLHAARRVMENPAAYHLTIE